MLLGGPFGEYDTAGQPGRQLGLHAGDARGVDPQRRHRGQWLHLHLLQRQPDHRTRHGHRHAELEGGPHDRSRPGLAHVVAGEHSRLHLRPGRLLEAGRRRRDQRGRFFGQCSHRDVVADGVHGRPREQRDADVDVVGPAWRCAVAQRHGELREHPAQRGVQRLPDYRHRLVQDADPRDPVHRHREQARQWLGGWVGPVRQWWKRHHPESAVGCVLRQRHIERRSGRSELLRLGRWRLASRGDGGRRQRDDDVRRRRCRRDRGVGWHERRYDVDRRSPHRQYADEYVGIFPGPGGRGSDLQPRAHRWTGGRAV